MKQEKLLKKIENFLLIATVFLVPLVVLPIFPNPFVIPKLAVLAFGAIAILFVKTLRLFLTGKIEMASSRFDLPVAIIALAYLAGAILITPNKMEAFFFPGTATLMLSSILLFYFINQLEKKDRNLVIQALVISGVITSVVSLLVASGLPAKIPHIPQLFTLKPFTSLDSPLAAVIFLLVLIPLSIHLAWEEKETISKAFWATSATIIIFGLALMFTSILPGKDSSPALLDFGSSWAIAVESLKNSPILGVGPGNYLTAFNRYRPLTFNSSEFWAGKFAQGRSFYFTAISEGGFLMAAGFVVLILVLYKTAKKKITKMVDHLELASLLLLVVFLAVFPSSTVLVLLLFCLLALSSKPKENEFSIPAKKLPAFIVATPLVVLCLGFAFFGSKAIAAEFYYNKALTALKGNQGTQTYELLRKAINLSPRVDRYHASYAQVNLALAQSLSQNKNDITSADRTTISQLIQQSIREGKATVTLNKYRAGNWAILGAIYRAIMPFAQGADNFTVQTYQQAVALDPTNPNLRINLGGVYFALERYDEAIKAFELATLAKNDLANAHYNLSSAYKQKGDNQKAIDEMGIVVNLLDKDSPDYQTAVNELEALSKQKVAPEAEPAEGSQLTPPQPAGEPVLTPPLPLSGESEPPAGE